jgi:hypothetical protein
MRTLMRLFVLTLLALWLAVPAGSVAQVGAGGQPLVVIRFNQPRVYFDQQLYGALTKALEIKPDLMIEVVSLAPSDGNPQKDQKWQATAGRNTRAVIDAIKAMGMPMDRIHVTGQSQPGLRYDETQVFVR